MIREESYGLEETLLSACTYTFALGLRAFYSASKTYFFFYYDSHIYMFRLGLIPRTHLNQQKVWKYTI
jgi:hypothetical protein